MGLREFLYFKHLVEQENPHAKVAVQYQLLLNGELADKQEFPFYGHPSTMTMLHENSLSFVNQYTKKKIYFNLNNIDDWLELDTYLSVIKTHFATLNPQFRFGLYLDGQPIHDYVCKFDSYFMMGDNRDNSKDSRFWGYLNRNFVKAKAFILYFSVDLAKKNPDGSSMRSWEGSTQTVPFYYFPTRIRWDRIGKLIRSFNETAALPEVVRPPAVIPAPVDSAAAL
jgi:hypothetical protein